MAYISDHISIGNAHMYAKGRLLPPGVAKKAGVIPPGMFARYYGPRFETSEATSSGALLQIPPGQMMLGQQPEEFVFMGQQPEEFVFMGQAEDKESGVFGQMPDSPLDQRRMAQRQSPYGQESGVF